MFVHQSISVRSHNICVTLPLHPYCTMFCTITNQNTNTLPPCASFTSIPSYLDQSIVTPSTFACIPPEYKCYWPVIIYQSSPLCSPAFSTPCLGPLDRQHPHTIKEYTSQCCIISGPYSQSYQSIGDLATSCMMFVCMMICKSASIIIILMSLHKINRILVRLYDSLICKSDFQILLCYIGFANHIVL
jgi:hypothetical protein